MYFHSSVCLHGKHAHNILVTFMVIFCVFVGLRDICSGVFGKYNKVMYISSLVFGVGQM